MEKIHLIVDHRENRRLLRAALSDHYLVTLADPGEELEAPFDLAILDGPALHRLWEEVRKRKRNEGVFLPFLLVTARRDVALVTRHLWRAIDEMILAPIEKTELSARVAVLLRARQSTRELAAANRELDAFTYSVSHDLRAPLRAIEGFSRILFERHAADLPDEGLHCLEMLREGSAKMQEMLEGLLGLSRLNRARLKTQVCHPDALVRDVMEDLESEREGRRIDLRIGELPACQGDPTLLRQVFANLLGNALKFTRPRKEAIIEVGGSAGKGETIYFVRDNGAGFDMRHADNLFALFQRLHPEEEFPGSGAGLPIVRRIVERHGGRVWAEGEVDKGATFWFALPEEKGGPEPVRSEE